MNDGLPLAGDLAQHMLYEKRSRVRKESRMHGISVLACEIR